MVNLGRTRIIYFLQKKRLLNLFTAHLKGLKQHQYQPKKECWRQCWQLFHLNIYTKHDLSFNKRQFLGGILKWSEEMKQSWWFIENASVVHFFLFLSMFQRPISQKHTFGKTWGTLVYGNLDHTFGCFCWFSLKYGVKVYFLIGNLNKGSPPLPIFF